MPDRAGGELTQLRGERGCVVDDSRPEGGCTSARALDTPGPFRGSRAIVVSPDGRNVYVAASGSDAITVFERDRRTGALSQPRGRAGCVAAGGSGGCMPAIGLESPNSVAISPDGDSVYATSRASGAVTSFDRDASTGRLTQAAVGCVATVAGPGCTAGRALAGADVVVVSPDGENVYVGAFFGNAIATFERDPSTGTLTQADGVAGCIAETASEGCATAIALGAPEGLAASADGDSVYVASAASNAVAVLDRDPTDGSLTQPADGCVTDSPLDGCATGTELEGANAVAMSPGDENVYATSLMSDSFTSFARATGGVEQLPGTTGCLVFLRAVGCSLGHAMDSPEGLDVSPDGENAYVAAFGSGAVATLDRDTDSGAVMQKPGRSGCVARRDTFGCKQGRRMQGVSSVVVSPDGRHVYATAARSDAVNVLRRAP
ncbi:beta-propeller fold lactonase family protein [Thermoleophilia bacterium SCSIO 60948]|nr:beta-propeller fold lactonase family protein [Thermoleophilia bacterium SCSIO 60948]